MSATAGRAGRNAKKLATRITKKSSKCPYDPEGSWERILPSLAQRQRVAGFTGAGIYVQGDRANCCPLARTRAEYLARAHPLSVTQYENGFLSRSSAVTTIKHSGYDASHAQRSPWYFESTLCNGFLPACYFPSRSHCQATIDLLFIISTSFLPSSLQCLPPVAGSSLHPSCDPPSLSPDPGKLLLSPLFPSISPCVFFPSPP